MRSTYIVDVAIGTVAAEPDGVGDVGQVDIDETGGAIVVTGTGANDEQQVLLLVNDDVVAAALRKVHEVGSHVRRGVVDDDALAGVDIEQLVVAQVSHSTLQRRANGRVAVYLAHVEDLDAVADELRSNDHVVLVAPDLLPEGTRVGRDRDRAIK